jgi:segregation and condensation protein B
VSEDQTSGEEAPESVETGDPSTTGVWPVDRLKPLVEALVFASGDPLPVKKMVEFVEGATAEEVKATLAELATDCLTRGVRLVEVAGGWQMRTAPEHQRYVRKLFRERPQKLTRAATETVAIVAYKQPVTRQEIETVRGVDSGGVLESLVEKRLVKVVGRKDVPGRPLVYATTQEFLELFGLKNIRDLPTLPELGSDFERMSEQGGFAESPGGAILPLEDEHGTQDDAGEAPGSQEAAGGQDLDDEGRQQDDEEGCGLEPSGESSEALDAAKADDED